MVKRPKGFGTSAIVERWREVEPNRLREALPDASQGTRWTLRRKPAQTTQVG